MGHNIVSLVSSYCDVLLGTSEVEGGLLFAERIERGKLDYSLESLYAVDRYLAYIHKLASRVGENEYTNTILAVGCYVGEVIRRNANTDYSWVNYADYFPHHPRLEKLVEEGVGTSAILLDSRGKMTMPLNKILRYIEEGPENETYFYAAAEVRGQDKME